MTPRRSPKISSTEGAAWGVGGEPAGITTDFTGVRRVILGLVTDSRLPILKALGDNTRYAIYLELARSAMPLSTADIAESLGLHANTVRPHLERMRDVGLLDVRTDATGGVGRPQHRYSLAAEAPSLGLEPPSYPLLARLLLRDCRRRGRRGRRGRGDRPRAGPATRAPGTQTPRRASRRSSESSTVLGFDPAVDGTDDGEIAVIAFTHCPFAELAEAHPELVCALHRGMVEGFVEQAGDASVDDFHTLAHREPCQVTISSR